MLTTLRKIRVALQSAHDEAGHLLYEAREVQAVADYVLEEVCGVDRMTRLLHPERVFTAEERARCEAVTAALQRGLPVQQAVGVAWFHGQRFRVSADVLIPRPETAELVDWMLHDRSSVGSLCDIGTGSGCIALSLALSWPEADVYAVDVSAAALRVASGNGAALHAEHVHYLEADILKEEENPSALSARRYDLIVSNPPYIRASEKAEMSALVVEHEPALALFVPDDDALCFYRAIGRFAFAHLHDDGALYVEINAALGQATCALFREIGFHEVLLRQDITGRDRMIRARHTSSPHC